MSAPKEFICATATSPKVWAAKGRSPEILILPYGVNKYIKINVGDSKAACLFSTLV